MYKSTKKSVKKGLAGRSIVLLTQISSRFPRDFHEISRDSTKYCSNLNETKTHIGIEITKKSRGNLVEISKKIGLQ